MDVSLVESAAAKHQPPAPPERHSPMRQLHGMWSTLASDFFLDVSGERVALGTSTAGCRAGRLDAVELRRIFRESHYSFQPLTVVLHPPTVCIKTFDLNGQDSSSWLPQHLHEVFPPGDRRQMRMVSAVVSKSQLIVAVVDRGVLNSISQVIWQAGGSIKAIVPAAAIDLSSGVSRDSGRSTSDWMLARYEYEYSKNALAIWPSCATGTETPKVNISVSSSHAKDHLIPQLDFLPQLKVTRPLPTQILARVSRSSLVATCILILLTAILYVSGRVYSSTHAGSKETSALSNRLVELQEQNREMRQQLDGLQSRQSGHVEVGRLLHAIAATTPEDIWLQRLEVQRMSDSHDYEFRLSGLSRSEKSPAAFAASLGSNSQIVESHLSRVGRADGSTSGRSGKAIEFDLQGRARANDSD